MTNSPISPSQSKVNISNMVQLAPHVPFFIPSKWLKSRHHNVDVNIDNRKDDDGDVNDAGGG